jgi:hypothetical protein
VEKSALLLYGFCSNALLLCRRVNHADSTVESLSAEIQRLVSERQELRSNGASEAELEQNRRRLTDAQTRYSRLLIQRYLPQTA